MQVQKYTKAAGILFIFTMIGGGLGEVYLPSTLIEPGNATATASNISANGTIFRLAFALYLVEAVCDIALSLVMYVILKPVNRNIALLSVCFGLVSTAVFAGGELFYFAPSFILGNGDLLKSFSSDQVNSLAMLSLRFYTYCAGIFMVFYGTATAIRGYLIYRSDFLPRALGALLMLAGLGFIVRNFALVMAPAYASSLFLAPMFVAGLSLMIWMLVKGVDVAKWEARASA